MQTRGSLRAALAALAAAAQWPPLQLESACMYVSLAHSWHEGLCGCLTLGPAPVHQPLLLSLLPAPCRVLQEKGLDTVDANRALGLPDDCREYSAVRHILADLGVTSIRLMTNNPRKLSELASLGITVTGRIPCQVCRGGCLAPLMVQNSLDCSSQPTRSCSGLPGWLWQAWVDGGRDVPGDLVRKPHCSARHSSCYLDLTLNLTAVVALHCCCTAVPPGASPGAQRGVPQLQAPPHEPHTQPLDVQRYRG